MTQVLMGHESIAKMMDLGNQVVTQMLQNAIKAMLANDMTKVVGGAKAARSAYLTGVSMAARLAWF
jgi:hypothetical protein